MSWSKWFSKNTRVDRVISDFTGLLVDVKCCCFTATFVHEVDEVMRRSER